MFEQTHSEKIAGTYKAACVAQAEACALNVELGIRPQTLMHEALGMTVYGWQDEGWDEFHGSETMGPGVRHDFDTDPDLDWLGREEDEALVTHRWNRPEDDLVVLDLIAEHGLQSWNHEILTALRRRQLHVVACAYFGTSDYLDREIVLKWAKSESGRWMPAEKKTVREWLADVQSEKGESQLAGFYSALQTLRFKLVRKDKNAEFAPNRAVLTTEQARRVVDEAVATLSSSAVAGYMEL